jgi:hypothetical protein
MTHPFSPAGNGEPAGSAPGATAAPGRAAGSAGPGVPLSIWPGLPESGGTRDGGPVTLAAARRVIGTFSVPGDLVAAAGSCSPAVAEAAAAAGRRVLVLVPDGTGSGYPLPVPYPVVRLRPGGPALVLAPGHPVTGQAALAVAGCCAGPGTSGQDGQDAGLLFAACERVLRPGGVLAVIAGPAAAGGTLTDTAGSVVAAARAAGLVYAQHIVLVRAEIDGDRLAPAAPSAGADAPGGSQVHDDLLVLTKPGGEARS